MIDHRVDIGRAVQAANRLLSPFAVTHPSQIDLEAVARSRDVLVYDSPLSGAEARLVRHRQGLGLIRIRPNIREVGRRRFTLAHELGHWELHAEYSQANVCSKSDIGSYGGSRLEIEANCFASELLMPTDLFRERCEGVDPDIFAIRHIADEFSVSLTAAAIRFSEECKKHCVVAFSENGVVQWWWDRFERYSDRDRKIWIPGRHKIQEGAAAWSCVRGEISLGQMEETDPAYWFPGVADNHSLRVREQSMRLGKYPIVITLLWIIDG